MSINARSLQEEPKYLIPPVAPILHDMQISANYSLNTATPMGVYKLKA